VTRAGRARRPQALEVAQRFARRGARARPTRAPRRARGPHGWTSARPAATSLPRSVRDRAAAPLASTASFADVVVALGDIAGGCDREEGGRVCPRGGAQPWRADLAEVAAPPGP
jgi:hypothetical protein